MKCPYDCGAELSEAVTGMRSHGCRNKLRAQRDALTRRVAELEEALKQIAAPELGSNWALGVSQRRSIAKEALAASQAPQSRNEWVAAITGMGQAIAASQAPRKEGT